MNQISTLTKKEFNRQKDTLNLIASENYPSPKTLNLLGSVWSNKYGEGYPGKRYYAGNQYTDELETFANSKALEIFDLDNKYGVNLQVLSGSPANSTVYLSILEQGDTIMSLNLASGGHLSHLHSTSNWGKFFKLVNYDLKEVVNLNGQKSYNIDIEDYTKKLEDYKPRLVILGFSSYTQKYEFSELIKLAHLSGSLVLADIAHINGLVACGLHSSPFLGKEDVERADFVSMTTHKTLRGPRGAMLFAKNTLPEYVEINTKAKSLIEMVNKTIFPGTSGGPHFQQIAAVAQSCLEILGEEKYPDKVSFKTYSQNVLDNTKSLENGLGDNGLKVISPTQNHLCLIKLPNSLDSLEFQQELESLGIITNRNSIPFDTRSPYRPSGMRFGMSALTSRGISSQDSYNLGSLIGQIANKQTSPEEIKNKTQEILKKLNWYYTF